jgi:hypothetical protein
MYVVGHLSTLISNVSMYSKDKQVEFPCILCFSGIAPALWQQEAKSTFLAKWTAAEFAAPKPGDTGRIREFIKAAFVDKRWFRAKKERKPAADEDEDDDQEAPPPPPPMSAAAMRAAAHKRRDSKTFAAPFASGDDSADFSFSPPPAARPSAAAAAGGFGDDDPFALPSAAPAKSQQQQQAAAQSCANPIQFSRIHIYLHSQSKPSN